MVVLNLTSVCPIMPKPIHNSLNNIWVSDSRPIQDIQYLLLTSFGLSPNSYYCLSNGRKINFSDDLDPQGTVSIVPKLVGGKGGFGSMLRAIGAQIEKTTNREACRDLSGRRLRDINEEQRLKNWIAQQADREREAAERKKKKLERLCQEPKHDFKDESYDESRSLLTEKVGCSIEQGFKASSSGIAIVKRKHTEEEKKPVVKKRMRLWIHSDESSSEGSEDDESPVHSPQQSQEEENVVRSSQESQDEEESTVHNLEGTQDEGSSVSSSEKNAAEEENFCRPSPTTFTVAQDDVELDNVNDNNYSTMCNTSRPKLISESDKLEKHVQE